MQRIRRLGAAALVVALGGVGLVACATDKSACTDSNHTVVTQPSTTVTTPPVAQFIDAYGSSGRAATFSAVGTDGTARSDDRVFQNSTTGYRGNYAVMVDASSASQSTGLPSCWVGGLFKGVSGTSGTTTGLLANSVSGNGFLVEGVSMYDTAKLLTGVQTTGDNVAVDGSLISADSNPVQFGLTSSSKVADQRLDDNWLMETHPETTGCGSIFSTGSGSPYATGPSPRSNAGVQISNNIVRYTATGCSWNFTYGITLTDQNESQTTPTQPVAFVNNKLLFDGIPANTFTHGTVIQGWPTPAHLGLSSSSCSGNVLMSNSIAIPQAVKDAWTAVCPDTTFHDPGTALSVYTGLALQWAGNHGY